MPTKLPASPPNDYLILQSEGRTVVGIPFDETTYNSLRAAGEPVGAFQTPDGTEYMGIATRGVGIDGPSQRVSMESVAGTAISEDEDQADWLGGGRQDVIYTRQDRIDNLHRVRWLEIWNPHVGRALQLYRDYVLGSDLTWDLNPINEDSPDTDPTPAQKKTIRLVKRLWQETLRHNRKWWSIKELGNRTYRDGEQMTYRQDADVFPPHLQFLDPEEIDGTGTTGDSYDDQRNRFNDPFDGIKTAEGDITHVISYTRINLITREIIGDPISAYQILHTKIDADSTEKRGKSRFLPVIKPCKQFMGFLEVEVLARKLQASIVLQRKVVGGQAAVSAVADNAQTGTTAYSERTLGREKFRPATIITTNANVNYEFLSPQTNFRDATPLAREIKLLICMATGWTESMLSGDGSGSNMATATVLEEPVQRMVTEEQHFFTGEIEPVIGWVIEAACSNGRLPGYANAEKFFEEFELEWTYPVIKTRDKLRERQADNIGVMNGSLSPQQACRNSGHDPEKMMREKAEFEKRFPMASAFGNQNPGGADKGKSSAGNAGASGGNQGENKTIEHQDKET